MKIRHLLLVLLALSMFNFRMPSTQAYYAPFDNGDYAKLWAKVDSLEGQGLPKSALEIVEKIYTMAQEDGNSDQIVKSFIYRLKFKNSREEDAFENLIEELLAAADTQQFPTNSIMESMLGEMYFMYYQANMWRFQNRTETALFEPEDMKTWSLAILTDKAIKHYLKSLEETYELQNTPVTVYEEIVNPGNQSRELRPTLYDFVAHRAIDFFINKQVTLTQPADKFELREDFYFADAKTFVKQNIQSLDTLSLHYHGIRILKDLLAFRLGQDNDDALIDVDLKRLDFVYAHSVNEIKDSLYLSALKSLEKKYEKNPMTAEVSFRIAQFYNNRSSKCNALQPETFKYKEDKKTAFDICGKTMDKYAGSSGAAKCQTLQCQILYKSLNFQAEGVILPNKKAAIKIDYTNMEEVYLKVAKVDYDKVRNLQRKYYGEELINELKKLSKEVYTKTIKLPIDKDYNAHSTEVLLDELPLGYYFIMVSSSPKFEYSSHFLAYDMFFVSELSYIYRKNDNGHYDVTVLNRRTGEPAAGVKAQTWYQEYNYTLQVYVWKKGDSYITDKDGYFEMKCTTKNSYYSVEIEFTTETDQLVSNDYFYLYYDKYTPSKNYSISFFTDRAIYRPGQTVYFKGIVINTDGENPEIVKGYSTTVYLYDVNYQKVADLKVTSNEFGTFSGTFQLPTNLLNGQFHIETSYGNKYFSVEEYKRPKFQVEMLPFEGNYRLKDKVTVKGKAKAFAGYSITDAAVAYRVTREPRWYGWWYWYYPSASMEIAHGKATTDDNGEFTIDFNAIPDLSMQKSEYLAFNYKVIVDVTDINGETQSTSKSLIVGYRSLVLNMEFPENIELEKSPFTKDKGVKITSNNLNGEPINSKGDIKIYSLKEPETPLKSRPWTRPDKHMMTYDEWTKKYPGNVFDDENELKNLKKDKEVFTSTYDTEKDKQIKIKNFSSWKPGRYLAEIYSKDAFGQEVSSKTYFTVYSTKTSALPVNAPDWFAISNNYGEPGDVAKFVVGSAEENVVVKYEVEHKNKIIHTEWLRLNKEQKVLEIPIEEKHRGNFAVHFTFAKDNKLYKHDALIVVPRTDKQLDIEFSTFRDKLYPGQEEEWRLVIKGALGDKVAAEMLATLYDASLDQFRINSWYYSVYSNYGLALSWQTGIFNPRTAQIYYNNVNPYCYYSSASYDYLDWFGFSYWNYNYYYYDKADFAVSEYEGDKPRRAMKEKSAAPMTGAVMEVEEEVMMDEIVADITSEQKPKNGGSKKANGDGEHEEQQQETQEVQIRTNMNETAFFYPHLQTDENGNVIIKFTIPEALTKWKMMGFAHTKDLKIGFIQNELVTQKDLMVMPNAPRFFRENDKITFPVKISNVSSGDLSGTVTLELLDGITMKPIEGIFAEGESKEKPFTVAAEKSINTSWSLVIPEGVQVITYRVIAKTAKFSDGEEKPIPVMTNRMLVTESLPLPIRGKQTKEFKFDKLLGSGSSSTLTHEKLTLEFTSNPAWYAIQALPYLMEYPYECSEQTFSRFYANSIAAHIANSNPKIKRVFDSWKNTPGSEALLSNLEKNQELKAVLLEETPWVLNAQDEGERKRRVGLLFDLNRMADELGRALKKLQQEQTVNGGWPWFKGMPESWYITEHIVAGMGHLDKLGIKNVREDEKTWKMVEKGISFIDREIEKHYDWLKKHYTAKELEEDHLDYMAIHYLYARSFFTDVKIPKRTQEAFDYFKGQEMKYWLKRSIYMQGMISLSLNRYEETTTAKKIVASLKEHALFHEELGMYWKNNVGGYYWYQAPIETQALMVEVFHEVTNDKEAVEELKVWLIKQKQTQDWKTTKATVEACYALLLQGTDWLASDELVEVKLADQVIDPRKIPGVQVEAGTGYFKTSWSKSEIKPEMGKVTVKNPNEVVAWGALYWQYFEQLDKITPHETPLKLNKKLFKEIMTDRGKVIEPIEATDILQVGDKIIVRIELRVDRDMEYVHMKDMRASGFEPINVISRYKWQDGLGYYETTKDASTNFFMDYMHKGTYVFEYPLRVTHQGDFSNGITTIQCMYAPEFTSHSEGIRVVVK
ncbi:MAG: hypothetical protein JXB49_11325 [Bacteroidales bacterium]|nr:hypothetical protein [Bacteroidales bacterium]